ncbi:MAG TPA: DMT family transporter [Clostridia bacterium]
MEKRGIFLAILAATLYALSIPLSKILLKYVSSIMMAAFLYIGAGIGILIMILVKKLFNLETKEEHLTKKEMPYILILIIFDIAAPVSLMFGLKLTTASHASLLNTFEIVITSLIALFFFKTKINPRVWVGIVLITISSIILSVKDVNDLSFSYGSLLVLLSCIIWGFENNIFKIISHKSPKEIVMTKDIFAGLGSLIIALCLKEKIDSYWAVALTMLLGFVAYGLSSTVYLHSQRVLGVPKATLYYAVSPFVGVILSFLIFRDKIGETFIVALVIMLIGAFLAANNKPLLKDKIKLKK